MKSKILFATKIFKKKLKVLLFAVASIVCINDSYAQLKIYSSPRSTASFNPTVIVCDPNGTEGMVVTTIENVGTSSATQTLSNIVFSADLLSGAAIHDGIETGRATTAIQQTAAGQTAITVNGISQPNTGLFSATVPGPITLKGGEKIEVTFYFKLNCKVLNSPFSANDNTRIVKSGATFSNSGTSSSLTESNPLSYNLIFPVLNLIVDPTSQAYIVNLNDHITRRIKLKNSINAGTIGNFTIQVKYVNDGITKPSGLILRNGSNVYTFAIPTPIGGSYAYIVTPTILNTLGLGFSLDAGEEFVIDESLDIVTCPTVDNTLTKTNYFVEWGCANANKPICNPNDGNAFSLIDKQPLLPNLSATITKKTIGKACENSTTPAKLTIEIKSNGATSKDIGVDIKPTLTYSGISITKLSIMSPTGVAYSVTPIPASGTKFNLNYTSDVDGAGGLEILDKGIYYNDLAAGKSIFLEVEYTVTPCASSCSGIKRSISAQAEYTALCSTVIQTTNVAQLTDDESQIEASTTNGPSDMTPGGAAGTITFTPRMQTSYQLLQNAYTTSATLTLPAGYALSSTPNATYTAAGSTTATAITATQSGQVVTLTGAVGINGTYSVNIVPLATTSSSPTYCTQGFDNFNWALIQTTTGTCNCSKRSIACASREVYRHRTANAVCGTPVTTSTAPCNKIASTTFNADRITYGYTQTSPNKTTGSWVDSDITASTVKATATTPNINKKAAYECDEIKVTTTGTITYNNTPIICTAFILRKDIHIRVSYLKDPTVGALFSLKPNSSTITIPGVTTPIPVNDPVVVYDAASNLYYYDFVFNNDININLPIAAGSIVLNTTFSVIKNSALPTIVDVNRFRGTTYVGTYSDGIESFGTPYKIYRPVVTITESSAGSSTNNLCDTKRMLKLTVSGGSAGNDFPAEFRSIAHPNKITYQLPPYYTYTPGSSFIKTQIGATTTSLNIDNPVITGTEATGWILTWTRNAGGKSWPLLDKQTGSYDTWLEFALVPKCNAPLGKPFAVSTEYSYHDYSSNGCFDSRIVTTSNSIDPRSFPNISIISQDQIAKDNAIFLPFTITNAGTAAPYTWVAFEGASNTQIVELYETIGGVDTKITTAMPYGVNNNSLWAKLTVPPNTLTGSHTYKLKVTFANCVERSLGSVNVFSGWDCLAYPAVPPNFPANTAYTPTPSISCGFSTGTLKYIHESALLRVDPMVFDAPKPICDATKFTIMLSSQGEAALNTLKGIVTLPVGVTLLGVRGQFVNNVGVATAYSNLTPTQVSVSPNSWSVDASSVITSNGITTNLRKNEYIKLEYSIQPSCDYTIIPPISFVATAKNSCADAVTSSAVATRIPVLDYQSLENIKVAIAAENFLTTNLNPNVTLTVTNGTTVGSFANTADVKVTVQLPLNVVYNNPVQGITPTTIVAPTPTTGQIITWIYAPNALPAGSSSFIKFNVKQTTGGVCDNPVVFLMDYESLSTTGAPAAAVLESDRQFASGCTGRYYDMNYRIMKGSDCFNDANWSGDPASTWYTSMQDHTTGIGKWFYAYSPSGTNNNLIWKKNVSVVSNTIYKFTYWLFLGGQQGVWWNGASQIQFNNEPAIYSNVTTNAQWTKVSANWNTGSNTTATIKLLYFVNPAVNTQGYDYETFTGLDDMELHNSCCFPITVETSLESKRICTTTNTVCTLKMVTSSANAEICLLGGGKSLAESIEDNAPLPVVKSSDVHEAAISIYPNPFTSTTTIAYQLDKPCLVNLEVFDVLGQKLETIVNSNQPAGEYQYVFTPKDNASGIYYVKMTVDGIVTVRKIVGMN